GVAADVAGTTVRTLQYYDRIGLVVARRTTDGRRGYDQALLERVHHIRLMSELGLGLDRIAELLAQRRDTPQGEVYAEQAAMLETAELRLRCRRAVAVGLAEVLRRHPDAEVPAQAMRALTSVEDTLLAYRDVGPPGTAGTAGSAGSPDQPTDEFVGQVIEIYLRWKALAVHALVLHRHGVEPASESGALLGRDWQGYLDFAASTGDAGETAGRSQSTAETWPQADRELYEATKGYLDACHRHHLARAGA
ncbi:MAG: MerR family transcriptional regulator, partial [Phycicoccus sp.]